MIETQTISLAFPRGNALKDFLKLDQESNVEDLIEQSLTAPLTDFFLRPRKNLRDEIVRLGFSIAARLQDTTFSAQDLNSACQACCAVLEVFHAGSLVIDDIQDDSESRRGRATLHRLYGMPLALNAGNWLYFLPFKYIEQMTIPEKNRADLIRACNDTLLRAHYGQALDLGVPADSLPQDRVREASLASMELKSGVLMGLAFKMGALTLGASTEIVETFDSLGRRFGIALQMMDDVGCLTSKHNPAKKCEDLKLKRLGFIFSNAAESLSGTEYALLRNLLNEDNIDLERILSFLRTYQVPEVAKKRSEEYLESTMNQLETTFQLTPEESHSIHTLKQHLVKSYE